jgi:flagellar hook-associated protein 3 FlgL
MTLRISTASLHLQGLQGLLKRQSEVAQTQQQMVTGKLYTRAAENPTAVSQAQRIDHAVASLDQFEKSAGLLTNRLRLQEEALADSGDVLSRARELALQANNASMSTGDRKLVAVEIRQLRAQLLAISNRDDGNERHLFAGRQDGVTPFTDSVGSVTYAGDDGRNMVDVAPDLALADTDPGSDVFMRVRGGDGTIRGSAAGANTGTGTLQSAEVTDFSAWPESTLTIRFTAADAYEVVDSGGTVLTTGAYASGDTITAAGVQTRITGAPAVGDEFVIEPAPNQDVFATLEQLADALDMPVATPADRARQSGAITASIGDIDTAQNHLYGIRAGTGARLAALDAATESRAAQDVTLRESLSQLRDVDYAEAATKLSLQLTAIDAAQRTMLRVQGLSLFDRL